MRDGVVVGGKSVTLYQGIDVGRLRIADDRTVLAVLHDDQVDVHDLLLVIIGKDVLVLVVWCFTALDVENRRSATTKSNSPFRL